MKTSKDAPITLVDGPLSLNLNLLLETIENDPDAFTVGRRNDDVVNWFLAKRMAENDTPGGLDKYPLRKYVEAFNQLELTVEQDESVYKRWGWESMSPERKIAQLWNHYGHITDLQKLAYYWIPVAYRVIGTAPVDMDPMF